MTVGTMREVFNGQADKTVGGLEKKHIKFCKVTGTYKSKAKVAASRGNPHATATGIWMREHPEAKLFPKKGSKGHQEILAIKARL